MYSRRLILGYSFFISLSLVFVYISGIHALVKVWWSLLVYAIIIYIILGIWHIFKPRPHENFLNFFITFLYKTSITLSILLVLWTLFLIYQNNISPATLPVYTLSNGIKTLRFQTMSHIASESFYKNVSNNIFEAKKQGFVLFYEGVLPGNKENTDKFNKLLGINFDPELYKNLSKIYGVTSQKNERFLGILNKKDYNVDISLDTVMEIYRKKNPWKSPLKKSPSQKDSEAYDLNWKVFKILWELSERELQILRYINQAFLNFILKHESLRNTIVEKLWKQDIFSVILDDRNINLANEIDQSTEKRIYVIYGLMHFSWVYKLLQEKDPNWKIIDSFEVQVITQS